MYHPTIKAHFSFNFCTYSISSFSLSLPLSPSSFSLSISHLTQLSFVPTYPEILPWLTKLPTPQWRSLTVAPLSLQQWRPVASCAAASHLKRQSVRTLLYKVPWPTALSLGQSWTHLWSSGPGSRPLPTLTWECLSPKMKRRFLFSTPLSWSSLKTKFPGQFLFFTLNSHGALS